MGEESSLWLQSASKGGSVMNHPVHQKLCSVKLEGFTILHLSLKKDLILIHSTSFFKTVISQGFRLKRKQLSSFNKITIRTIRAGSCKHCCLLFLFRGYVQSNHFTLKLLYMASFADVHIEQSSGMFFWTRATEINS